MEKTEFLNEFLEVFNKLDAESQKSIFQLLKYHDLSNEEKAEFHEFLRVKEVPGELVEPFIK